MIVWHSRLEQRLKEVEIDHQEAISALQSKQETEMIRLKGLLANSETMQTELQREVGQVLMGVA